MCTVVRTAGGRYEEWSDWCAQKDVRAIGIRILPKFEVVDWWSRITLDK